MSVVQSNDLKEVWIAEIYVTSFFDEGTNLICKTKEGAFNSFKQYFQQWSCPTLSDEELEELKFTNSEELLAVYYNDEHLCSIYKIELRD